MNGPIITNAFTVHIKEDPADSIWKVLARDGKTIEAIKSFRNEHPAGLYEAKKVVEHYQAILAQVDVENGVTVANPNKSRVISLHGTRIIVTETVPGFYNVKEVTDTDLGTVGEDELLQFLADTVLRKAAVARAGA